jgi:hypothetical protein
VPRFGRSVGHAAEYGGELDLPPQALFRAVLTLPPPWDNIVSSPDLVTAEVLIIANGGTSVDEVTADSSNTPGLVYL